MSKREYEARAVSWVVVPKGEEQYSEMATTIRITDESAGEFVEVEQSGRTDVGKICIDVDEWPTLRKTIDLAIAACRAEGGAS